MPGLLLCSTAAYVRKKATMKVDDDEAVDFSEPLPPAVEVKSQEVNQGLLRRLHKGGLANIIACICKAV